MQLTFVVAPLEIIIVKGVACAPLANAESDAANSAAAIDNRLAEFRYILLLALSAFYTSTKVTLADISKV
jgi:hypothetical protein